MNKADIADLTAKSINGRKAASNRQAMQDIKEQRLASTKHNTAADFIKMGTSHPHKRRQIATVSTIREWDSNDELSVD